MARRTNYGFDKRQKEKQRQEKQAQKRQLRQERKEARESGEITEDEQHQDRDEIQKLTDRFCAEIDEIVKAKEAEIMQV